MEVISDINDNIIDNLFVLFKENNFINSESNINNNSEELNKDNMSNEEEELYENYEFSNISNKEDIEIHKFKKLTSEDKYIFEGDDELLLKINNRKNKKKFKTLNESNLLDELEYNK